MNDKANEDQNPPNPQTSAPVGVASGERFTGVVSPQEVGVGTQEARESFSPDTTPINVPSDLEPSVVAPAPPLGTPMASGDLKDSGPYQSVGDATSIQGITLPQVDQALKTAASGSLRGKLTVIGRQIKEAMFGKKGETTQGA